MKTFISPNLKKTSDRLTPGGQIVNLQKPKEEEVSKEDEIKQLEEKLKQLKGE